MLDVVGPGASLLPTACASRSVLWRHDTVVEALWHLEGTVHALVGSVQEKRLHSAAVVQAARVRVRRDGIHSTLRERVGRVRAICGVDDRRLVLPVGGSIPEVQSGARRDRRLLVRVVVLSAGQVAQKAVKAAALRQVRDSAVAEVCSDTGPDTRIGARRADRASLLLRGGFEPQTGVRHLPTIAVAYPSLESTDGSSSNSVGSPAMTPSSGPSPPFSKPWFGT